MQRLLAELKEERAAAGRLRERLAIDSNEITRLRDENEALSTTAPEAAEVTRLSAALASQAAKHGADMETANDQVFELQAVMVTIEEEAQCV